MIHWFKIFPILSHIAVCTNIYIHIYIKKINKIFILSKLKANLSFQQLTVSRQGISSPFDNVGIESATCPV